MITTERLAAWLLLVCISREIIHLQDCQHSLQRAGYQPDPDAVCLRVLQALEATAPHVVAKFILDRHTRSGAQAVKGLADGQADLEDDDLPF